MPLPDHEPPRWLDLWIHLTRQLRLRLANAYQAEGLNETRSAILIALSTASRPCTQTDLAAALGLSESNLCTLIERMRHDGLLIRERSTLDRRKTLLSLTESGSLQRERVLKIHQHCEAQLADRLSAAENDELCRLLSVLADSEDSRTLSLSATPCLRRAS